MPIYRGQKAPVAPMAEDYQVFPRNGPAAGQIGRKNSQAALPAPDVSAASLEDRYVQFILFCNPSIPDSVDVSKLREGFNNMPKSDGRKYDMFLLFEQIRRFENKEILTWAQLLLDLGVPPPDLERGQSTQRVQQFGVRLKRWLHAYHIDAYFQYCLSKPNEYYMEIPDANTELEGLSRDGVLPEEDLALQSLLPQYKPKRAQWVRMSARESSANAPRSGSLAADDTHSVQDEDAPHEVQSAFPWGNQTGAEDVWVSAERTIISGIDSTTNVATNGRASNRSRDPQPERQYWLDPHPQSAHPFNQQDRPFETIETSQSAHPSSLKANRKRKYPTLSAGWSGTKNRGRPPGIRATKDGHFSTFPAQPASTEVAPLATKSAVVKIPPPQFSPPLHNQTPASTIRSQQLSTSPYSARPHPGSPPVLRRPSKLSLQVPQSSSGPIRLATPPAQRAATAANSANAPRVLLNGHPNTSRSNSLSRRVQQASHERRSSADFFNAIDDEADVAGTSELWDSERDVDDDGDDGLGVEVWRKRAVMLRRRLREKERELKDMRRRVMEAVM